MSHLIQNYKRFNIGFKSGKGCKLIGTDGKEYLDFLSGVGVLNLGHSNPIILNAIKKQVESLCHVSNYFQIEQQEKLAEILCKNTFAEKVLFLNSGTESAEAALKLARKWSYDNFPGKKKHKILALNSSFHGRTYGSLSATGQGSKKDSFKPLVPGFVFINPNDEKALEKNFNSEFCAIIMEPILGEGGVIPLNESFIKKARKLCDKNKALLIFDEVQTGNGRTGKLYCYQYFNVIPDILVTSKALGNGLPIGALMTTNKISETFSYGTHGCTFGGNPLVCSSAIASLTELSKVSFLYEVNKKSKYLSASLEKLKKKHGNKILEIRGKGLMIGIKISLDTAEFTKQMLDLGVIVNAVTKDTIRILPPLIISEKEIDLFIKRFEECLKN